MTNTFMNDDLTREEIVDRYRKRIIEEKRTKLTRIEREQLALLLVETLIHLSDAGEDSEDVIRSLCQEEIELLEEGYPQASISNSYLPIYTQLIKEAIASGQLKLTDLNSYEKPSSSQDKSNEGTEWQHYALDFLLYEKKPQRHDKEVSASDSDGTNDTHYPIDVESYLKKARELLNSSAAEDIAIALCALTGQRYSDLIQVKPFDEPEFPYLMRCEESSNTASSVLNILTLIPVREILPHFHRWQQMVSHLGESTTQDSQSRAFVARINHRIRKAFEFTQIIPIVKGSKTVSIQWLRNAYGAIALYFFCPPTHHTHDFLKHYFIHLLDIESSADLTVETVQHHFHYVPARHGKIIPAIGIKIPAHGPAPLTEVRPATEHNDEKTSAKDTDMSAKDTDISAPLTRSFMPEELESVVATQVKTIANQAQTINWLTAEIQELREKIQQLTTEHDEAIAQVHELPALQDKCQQLQQENQTLRLAQQKVDAFKALLLDNEAGKQSVEPSSKPSQQSNSPLQPDHGSKPSHPSNDPKDRSNFKQPSQPSRSSRQRSKKQSASPKPKPSAPAFSDSDILESTSTPSSSRHRLLPTKESKAQQRAASIVAAIQSWNHQHPDRSFAITKGLLEHEFGINRKAASEFLVGNRQTLLDYYQTIGVKNERGHNRQPGRDIEMLKTFIDKIFQQSHQAAVGS